MTKTKLICLWIAFLCLLSVAITVAWVVSDVMEFRHPDWYAPNILRMR